MSNKQEKNDKKKNKESMVCKVAGKYNGGRFDFDDGGTYCGGWDDGKAHGHGVCTGPDGQGEYAGAWHFGYEVSGVYTWPGGSQFLGQWMKGVRHGLGLEKRGRWMYRGEWHEGAKGRYGVRQSTTSTAKFEGTWLKGLQDGYGTETYADGGTYKGQWSEGNRQGYGVRTSAPFGDALTVQDRAPELGPIPSFKGDQLLLLRDRKVDSGKGGFVLRAGSGDDAKIRPKSSDKGNLMNVFKGSKIRRQKSVGDLPKGRSGGSMRSSGSTASYLSGDSAKTNYTFGDNPDGSNASFCPEDDKMDPSVVEIYMGEWKQDKREGFGCAERSDGLKYEGEWHRNRKCGYGVTYFKDGTREEGKYKNNVLISSKRKYLLMVRSAKFKDRVDAAITQAERGAKIAMQKEDIAISRTVTARSKAEQADIAARHALEDCDMARAFAKNQAPDFLQPGLMDTTTALLSDPTRRDQSRNISKQPTPAPESLADDFLEEDQEMSLAEGPGYTSHNASGLKETASNRRSSAASSFADGPISQYSESTQPSHMGTDRSRPHSKAPTTRQTHSAIMNDRLDHYNRPPSRPPSRPASRDRSYDRMASRGQTPVPTELINPRSRAPSVQRAPATDWTPDSGMYDDESGIGGSRIGSRRSSRPSSSLKGDTKKLTGNGAIAGIPHFIPSNQQEAESMIRQRACGQEITPSMTPMGSVKRTESLYINPVIRKQAQIKESTLAASLRRKQSIPDARKLGASNLTMSREEASVLSSQQRETVRRNIEESQRYRENPLLYLTSPRVLDWFSKQKLVMLILFVNLSLAYMFFKLLS